MVADILPKWAGRACVDANVGCLTWRSAPVPGRDPAAGSVAIRYTVLVEKDGIRLVECIQRLVPASCGGDDGVGIGHGSERLTKA